MKDWQVFVNTRLRLTLLKAMINDIGWYVGKGDVNTKHSLGDDVIDHAQAKLKVKGQPINDDGILTFQSKLLRSNYLIPDLLT